MIPRPAFDHGHACIVCRAFDQPHSFIPDLLNDCHNAARLKRHDHGIQNRGGEGRGSQDKTRQACIFRTKESVLQPHGRADVIALGHLVIDPSEDGQPLALQQPARLNLEHGPLACLPSRSVENVKQGNKCQNYYQAAY
ncbi:hypothetical protein GDI3907 (plasmid) [Gluconacetobacter diazotrophicus PA1 5]|uniref:Uncharacterized protein n=1 Tax=Gluconacetobacter diazotrophicus (strain ATCC 49037 / DSM 5601 / CCUG 37298 / CIP 103539 / LMG 7603 / PAl5) TaxID=272568 RepID=A9HT78_GLUDA|nr:hypothetical protein GDI3907 [Gluconacetobacter diazotrophicus PA1 5]